jgi:excisionase family DNA binding protein
MLAGMTVAQVADYLRRSTKTVYRLIRQDRLRACKDGRRYSIREADLLEYMLANGTRPEVGAAIFRRVLEIGNRNAARHPNLTSDHVLDELESWDEERKRVRARSG